VESGEEMDDGTKMERTGMEEVEAEI